MGRLLKSGACTTVLLFILGTVWVVRAAEAAIAQSALPVKSWKDPVIDGKELRLEIARLSRRLKANVTVDLIPLARYLYAFEGDRTLADFEGMTEMFVSMNGPIIREEYARALLRQAMNHTQAFPPTWPLKASDTLCKCTLESCYSNDMASAVNSTRFGPLCRVPSKGGYCASSKWTDGDLVQTDYYCVYSAVTNSNGSGVSACAQNAYANIDCCSGSLCNAPELYTTVQMAHHTRPVPSMIKFRREDDNFISDSLVNKKLEPLEGGSGVFPHDRVWLVTAAVLGWFYAIVLTFFLVALLPPPLGHKARKTEVGGRFFNYVTSHMGPIYYYSPRDYVKYKLERWVYVEKDPDTLASTVVKALFLDKFPNEIGKEDTKISVVEKPKDVELEKGCESSSESEKEISLLLKKSKEREARKKKDKQRMMQSETASGRLIMVPLSEPLLQPEIAGFADCHLSIESLGSQADDEEIARNVRQLINEADEEEELNRMKLGRKDRCDVDDPIPEGAVAPVVCTCGCCLQCYRRNFMVELSKKERKKCAEARSTQLLKQRRDLEKVEITDGQYFHLLRKYKFHVVEIGDIFEGLPDQ